MNKKMIIPVLILALLVLTPFINSAYATSYTQITRPFSIEDTNLANIPETQNLAHRSGKYVYACVDAVYNNPLYTSMKTLVYIFNIDGSLDTSFYVTPTQTHYTNAALKVYGIFLYDLNATSFILGQLYRYNVTQYQDAKFNVEFSVIGINSHVVHQYPSTNNAQYGSGTMIYPLNGFTALYNNYLYFFYSIWNDGDNTITMEITKFNLATYVGTTYAVNTETTKTVTGNPLYGFQDTIQNKYIHIVQSYGEDNYLTHFKRADLSSATPTMSNDLCVGSDIGVIPPSRTFRYIGGGINQSGTYLYVYHTFAFPYTASTVSKMKLMQFRAEFNDSVTVANFVAQNERSKVYILGFPLTWIITSIIGGYMDSENYGHMFYYDKIYGLAVGYRSDFTIPDFYNMGISTINSVETADYTFPTPYSTAPNWVDNCYRDFTSSFMIDEFPDPSTIFRLYYGMTATQQIYALTTSYSPLDSPLIQSTRYLFTTQLTLNGVPVTAQQKIYLNGVDKGTRNAPNGYLQVTITFTETGINNLTFVYYVGTSQVYSETQQYIVVVSAIPPPSPYNPSAQMATVFTLLDNIGLIFLLLGTPTFMGILMYEAKKPDLIPMGIVTGLAMGGIVSLITGLLPVWGFILICVCVVGYIVVMTRSTGGVVT